MITLRSMPFSQILMLVTPVCKLISDTRNRASGIINCKCSFCWNVSYLLELFICLCVF